MSCVGVLFWIVRRMNSMTAFEFTVGLGHELSEDQFVAVFLAVQDV